MQPNPNAETSNPVLPSFRFCIKSPSPTLLESQRLDSNGAPTDSVANMDVSANHKACGQRRVVRRTPGQHLIFARGRFQEFFSSSKVFNTRSSIATVMV